MDPIEFEARDVNFYRYVGNDCVNFVDPSGLDMLHTLSDYSAGFGDAVSFGLTKKIRKLWKCDKVVDKCSKAYSAGEWTSMGLGGARLGYAGLAKGVSLLSTSGRQAAHARNILKKVFRANPFSKYRVYPYEKLLEKYGSDAAIKAAAGRTNTKLNMLGGSGAAGGAYNYDKKECE